ncbi:MAG: GNAT family N-acetyltransferase [Cypionkella sp.]|uniref:GNAT family N-acetyltransferase n=1 Tax=Cypionkella sp. TaxID=2811411 RepID=UPI002ABBB8B3|nr:GNAT family N-acetyltransferase [Cypionkella sp.]MDZ4310282.1 GNAT family N-acetyltransferase [Cypionkella sp.]
MIRAASPADAPDIAAILAAWNRDTVWMPKLHTPAEDLQFAQHLITHCTTRVLYGPDTLGFLSRAGQQIEALYLVPAARGKGLGRLLLNEAKAACAELTLYTFQANLSAQRFYAREGFTEIARSDGRDNAEQLPDLRLVWRKEPQ